MKRLLLMDDKDYDPDLSEIYRVAVRGIIFIDGKLLLIESNFGELKLPGGGQEKGEDDLCTLIREVKEETGFTVLEESVREFGYLEEIRLSVEKDRIWHQISRLYFCEVDPRQGECTYSSGEKKEGFRQVFYTLEDAIQKNEEMLRREGEENVNMREYRTLLLIREYLE